MQKLPKLLILLFLAGTVIAINPCTAAQSPAKAPSSSAVTAGAKGPASEPDFLASLEAADQHKPKQDTREQSMPLTVIGFVFKLALVVGLCYASILGLKKFSNMKPNLGTAKGRIKVVENSTLGANRSLHIVQIGSKRLLVASTPNQVSLLTELEADETPDPAPDEPVQGFREQLAQFLGKKLDTTQSAKTVGEMMRDSSSHIQNRVMQVGSLRRTFRDA